MKAEMNYEILDKGGTLRMTSLLSRLVEKLAERREMARNEYCSLAMDQCPFAPLNNDGLRDIVIQFVADDIIDTISMVAYKNGLRADMNTYAPRLKEVLEHYATKH